MKLATFSDDGAPRVGVVLTGDARDPLDTGAAACVVDLSAASPSLPRQMNAFLAAGSEALSAARRACETGSDRIPLSGVRLHAPVPRPGKFLGVGLNYRDHVAETAREVPEIPILFNKQTSCVTGPFDAIHLPRVSKALDYEGELAFVIGRRCRHVPAERAHEAIAGYTVCNDVSVRDWQRRVQTMTMGKSFDTHGPLGPWIVTGDALDPHGLALRTFVNGELRQDSNTKELVFDCYALVEHLSTAFTLEPGDVITTGTPGGVGSAMQPPSLLRAGDVVRIEIEGIGAIENRVVDEPSDTDRI